MPAVSVSMVCESTTANVTAALRESLGSSVGGGGNASCSAVAAATAATGNAVNDAVGSNISSAALIPKGSGGGSNNMDNDDSECLQSKLIASAKRVLLSKVDYEEVDNYGQSVLDTLKSKYIVLKSNTANTNNINNPASTVTNGNSITDNERTSPSTCNNNNSSNNGANLHNGVSSNGNSAADCNGNSTTAAITLATAASPSTHGRANALTNSSNAHLPGVGAAIVSSKRPSAHELPQPKRVLFPRENVKVGWKNGTRKWHIGVGMMNVGNTCYLNSTLQALFHVPAMANWLASETQHMERCECGGDAGCIICAMCKTLLMAQTHTSPIRPYYVYSKLRSICKHLVMGRQEDAHEFLRYLVEAMEKSYLQRFRNHKELDQYSKETTPMNQILGGYLKSAVRCLACNHVSVTFQHFQDLLLDIRKADTIEEALEAYFSRERLEDMGYKCESCKKKVSATKQFTLERAPIALCIQLKRFSMIGSKLNKQIAIRPRLDLSKYLSRKQPNEHYTYKLVSMITHLGASQHCGHYTAIGLTESGAYYNFDDSCVRPISVQGVCNTNAYIIFYELEHAPNPTGPRIVPTSTQSSVIHFKENNGNVNYQLKTNGFPLAIKNINNVDNNTESISPSHRLIGPQLPPGGLHNYNSSSPSANSNGNKNTSGGIKLKNVITNCNNTNGGAGPGFPSSPGNPKIMIHFKNGQATIRSNATSTTTTSISNAPLSSTSTLTTTTCGSGGSSSNNNNNTKVNDLQNGNLHVVGIGKFQESSYTKLTLVGSPSKSRSSTLAKLSNFNENSCGSEPEDGVSSTTAGYTDCSIFDDEVMASSLPSMPNLFDDDETKAKHNNKTNRHTIATATSKTNAISDSSKNSSLVPYDLESDDDMWNSSTTTLTPKRQENQSPLTIKVSGAGEKLLLFNNNSGIKRQNCILSEQHSNGCLNDDDTNDLVKSKKSANSHDGNANLNATTNSFTTSLQQQQTQSKNKQKTENPIDEIFNTHTKVATNNGSNNNSNVSNKLLSSPSKLSTSSSLKRKSQSPQLTLPVSEITTSPGIGGGVDNGACDSDRAERSDSPTAMNFFCSEITPPSPPLIQTKTGLWQVTSINSLDSVAENVHHDDNDDDEHNDDDDDDDHEGHPMKKTKKGPKYVMSTSFPLTSSSSSTASTPSKTWINPFSSKSVELTETTTTTATSEKRAKFIGNGYKSGLASANSESNSNGKAAVSELLQQSHRGYGAPVLTWDGDQNDIEKEIKTEVREQRQQDLDDEEENEMDRGRQKKVKQINGKNESAYERTPGYNSFQEQQDSQRRWKSNGNGNGNGSASNGNGSNPYRYYNANYRQQPYQRNKFKFQRYNYNKYQRPQQNASAAQQQQQQQHQQAMTMSTAANNVGGGNNNNNNNSSSTNSNGFVGRRES